MGREPNPVATIVWPGRSASRTSNPARAFGVPNPPVVQRTTGAAEPIPALRAVLLRAESPLSIGAFTRQAARPMLLPTRLRAAPDKATAHCHENAEQHDSRCALNPHISAMLEHDWERDSE